MMMMTLVLIMMSAMKSCWYNIDNWDKYERFFFGLNWQLCLIAWAWQFVTLWRTYLSRFVVHICHILLYLIVTYCCTWLLNLVVTLVCHVLLYLFVTLALDFFIWNREETDILEPMWQLGNSVLLQRNWGFLLIYRVTKKVGIALLPSPKRSCVYRMKKNVVGIAPTILGILCKGWISKSCWNCPSCWCCSKNWNSFWTLANFHLKTSDQLEI